MSNSSESANIGLFVVFFFLLCIISALFSCLISYSARKAGLKPRMQHQYEQFLFATLPKRNQHILDVKEWMALVLSPEKAKEPFRNNSEDRQFILTDGSRYSQILHYDEMLY